MNKDEYDVIVVGAGHAGCEAALAAARSGASTALITMSRNHIACMPCNPAIGGIAKSHLVFELDALGGEMAKNADYSGLQFRTLNTRKGPAVQANRVQCDKHMYSQRMIAVLEQTENLTIIPGKVISISLKDDRLQGVKLLDNTELKALSIVLAPGTSLNGKIYIGDHCTSGGGDDEGSADDLSDSIKQLGFKMARLKTGTPPRLKVGSLNYSHMQIQEGDEPPPFFSWQAYKAYKMFHVEHCAETEYPKVTNCRQMSCYLTHTTEESHRIIRDNLERSSLYGGLITGTGVRYCPSIEDKIVKFSDKASHHVFIEPEGWNSDLLYPNGISNSLPEDVQQDLVHSIPGLEDAEIVKFGYAIEYDFSDPTQLLHTLETKLVRNLFMAGQINGTTGYEEAAAQGFVAGVNAAHKALDKPELRIDRTQAYIGVLIDDLVIKGTNEPYRMFTSRSEHRLLLRQDNARYRLLELSQQLGIASKEFLAESVDYMDRIQYEIMRLNKVRNGEATLAQILRRPGVCYSDLEGGNNELPYEVGRQVEISIKYEGYIERELRHAQKAKGFEKRKIPADIEYNAIKSLRIEAREKFTAIRPETLGQALRIPGISPADIAVLDIYVNKDK